MELQKKEDPLLRKKERPNIAKNQNRHLTLYKNNCGLIINRKVVARLPASDFPAENPRTQTRNYYYTRRCQQCVSKFANLKKPSLFFNFF